MQRVPLSQRRGVAVGVWENICAMVKSRVFLGMVIPPLIDFNRNPYNGYINPYYWVDDHPLLYGNNGSLDPGTICVGFQRSWARIFGNFSMVLFGNFWEFGSLEWKLAARELDRLYASIRDTLPKTEARPIFRGRTVRFRGVYPQGWPLVVINGVIAHINGLING